MNCVSRRSRDKSDFKLENFMTYGYGATVIF